MELAPGGVECIFEVTYDSPSLHVGMSVYDTTGVSPVLVAGPTAMTHVINNTYIGKFTPTNEHSYLIFKAVYTDSGLTSLDSSYAAGTESVIAETVGAGSSAPIAQPIIGIVIPNPTVIGIVRC